MTSIVQPRKTSPFVGVVLMTFIECFNTSCASMSPSPFQYQFCQLLRLFREMEIINGIKFHAIISFDFPSHFLFACFVLNSLNKEGGSRTILQRKFQVLCARDPRTLFSFLLLRLSSAIFTVSRNSFEQWLKGFLYVKSTWRILFYFDRKQQRRELCFKFLSRCQRTVFAFQLYLRTYFLESTSVQLKESRWNLFLVVRWFQSLIKKYETIWSF